MASATYEYRFGARSTKIKDAAARLAKQMNIENFQASSDSRLWRFRKRFGHCQPTWIQNECIIHVLFLFSLLLSGDRLVVFLRQTFRNTQTSFSF